MSAEIDMSNNRANIAYIGAKPWHSLGTEMSEGQSLDDWKREAGLDWAIEQSDVSFAVDSNFIAYPDRKILYRSDTKAPLGIVSKDYKIVQPVEIIEFFRDLVERYDMKLNTAGSLFGGKRYWALAELGKSVEIVSGDIVNGYLLLSSSADSSIRTTSKFVSQRVCCQNTLTIALNEKGKTSVAVSHRSNWDPDSVKLDLGLIDASWFNFIDGMRRLASKKISTKQAQSFYQELIFENKKPEPTGAELRKVEKLMNLYDHGIGAELSQGTAWGWLNAVTEAYTHGTGRKDPSAQMWDSSIMGVQDNLKTRALELVNALV